uniref:RNase H type-1 domain-containing protein n=1 Tax=Cannabis sativa TaxID=3483 RepID=A0A803Q693_CANSA
MIEADANSSYLGLPSTIGKNKNAILGFLKEKVLKRIKSWDTKFLSHAGKEVLIKTVVQSLPTYVMSVFLLPVGVCKEIESLMARFWWKSSWNQNKGISWMSWSRLVKQKFDGGMGFRSLRDFNIAMLCKQGWRLIINPNSLVRQVFKVRYYAHGEFLTAELGSNPSFIWRSLVEAQSVLKAGLRMWIGDGLSIRFVSDLWLPREEFPTPTSDLSMYNDHRVNSLFKVGCREWDEEVVRDVFNEGDAEVILGIPLAAGDARDSWYWFKERHGVYSVKTAYHCLLTESLALGETISHCLLNCDFVVGCWSRMALDGGGRVWDSFKDWLQDLMARVDDWKVAQVGTLCWAIWKARNELVWDQKNQTVDDVVQFALRSLDQWRKAQSSENYPLLNPQFFNKGDELWTKLVTNGIKLNVDAAIFDDSRSEAMGIREALSWLKDKPFQQVCVESDSLVSVQAINSSVVMYSAFGLIVQDCKSLLDSMNNVSLRFVKRSANRAAHVIARQSQLFADRMFTKDDIPSELKVVLLSDSS